MNPQLSVNIHRIQYIAIAGSIGLLFFLFELIRKKRLKEEYSLLWLFFTGVFLLFSIWRDALTTLSFFIGVAYPPATLFLLFILAIFAILIHYSIVISRLTEQNKVLVQELGLLKLELETLRHGTTPDEHHESETG